MQGVSTTFSGTSQSNFRQLSTAVQVSWDKTTASGIQYFTIGTSTIGGSDIIKSTGGGTIALANQYNYTTIPASGIISWNVSIKLDQFPYGMVQRQAEIVLNNADERLLPASGTALGPYIESGRPIIIQGGFGNETIPLFTGYSDSPVNDYNTRTTTIHAYDAIDFLNSYNSKGTSPVTNTRADNIIALLLAEAGFATNQYVLETSLNPVIPYFDPFGKMIGDVINDLCEAEGAIFFADEAGIMHFWNRQHFSNNSTPVTTLTYSNMATLQQQSSPIINYVQTESAPLALVSGTQQVYSLDQPYYIQANGSNAYNGITNPSFEVSTSGWTGTLARTNVTSQTGAGSWSASGTRMIYDLSSMLVPEAGSTGYTANAQFAFRAPIGATGLATLSGTTQVGQALAGTWTQAISGTNQWQTFSLNGNHFGITTPSGLSSWTATTALPASLINNGFIANNGYLYVIGGLAGGTVQSKSYYAPLSPGAGPYSLTSSLPTGTWRAGFANTSSGIYMIGGSQSSGSDTASVYYSPFQANGSLGTWSGTSSLPAIVEAGVGATNGAYVYLMGGYNSPSTKNTVYLARINADNSLATWSATTPLPANRMLAGGTTYSGYMYLFGGLSSSLSSSTTNTSYYSAISASGTAQAWNTTTVLPQSLYGLQAVPYNGYMYVLGGATSGATVNTAYYAKVNADGSLGAWNNATSLPYNASQFGATVNNQYLYISGGSSTNDYYTNFNTQGVNLTVSGARAFYLDAVSSDTADSYFDGSSTGNNTYSYAWTGTAHNSPSTRTAMTNYLTVRCSLNAETYSISQPTASGLNASNIAATQSYYSFSSVSGTGGIYGTDMTSNISLVNYSVSGTTAFLTFQNNSSNQAYLTNLVLYGQTAQSSTSISQYYLDQQSINSYRLNPTNNGQIMTISNDYIPTSLAAQSLAQYLVQGFKTPYLRHSTDIFALPQLQFGDCVQLANSDTGEMRIGYVMGITNSLDSEANLKQSLVIQERNLASYFTIGTSPIGGSAQIAP